MTIADWELSDQLLENLPKKGHAYREPDGRTKDKSKLEKIQRLIASVAEIPERTVTTIITAEEANLASTSGTREETEQVPLRLEGVPEEAEEAEEEEERPLKRRRRLVKGKKPATQIPLQYMVEAAAELCPPEIGEESSEGVRALNPKVVIDMKKGKAFVDLKEDWYPSGSCPAGTAQSMNTVLYSESLFKQLADSSMDQIREEFARHSAVAWCMGSLLGVRQEEERGKCNSLREKIIDLEENNSILVQRNREKFDELKKKDAEYEQSLSNLAKGYEESTKEAFERARAEYKQKLSDYKKKMTVIKSSNRRLKKQVSEVEEEAARNIREGISLCLDNLHRAGVIPLEWKNVERVESLAMSSMSKEELEAMAALAAGEEVAEEVEEPEVSDSDAASAT